MTKQYKLIKEYHSVEPGTIYTNHGSELYYQEDKGILGGVSFPPKMVEDNPEHFEEVVGIDEEKWVEVINGWMSENLMRGIAIYFEEGSVVSDGDSTVYENTKLFKYLCRRAIAEELNKGDDEEYVAVDKYGCWLVDITIMTPGLFIVLVKKSKHIKFKEVCSKLNLFEK